MLRVSIEQLKLETLNGMLAKIRYIQLTMDI